MRVMVLVKATKESEAGVMPGTELMAAMGDFNEQLVKAGVMLADLGDEAVRELVGGFWLWQVKSMDEAVEWVRRCPNPMPGDSEIEIRPLFEAADFGAEFTPELQAREDRLRAEVDAAAKRAG